MAKKIIPLLAICLLALSSCGKDLESFNNVKSLQSEPKAEEPKAEEPKAEEPKAEEPKAEEPKAEEPKAEEPKAEEPKAEEPKAEEPKAEEPKAEEPKAEEPKAEEPKAEEPKAEEPKPEPLIELEFKPKQSSQDTLEQLKDNFATKELKFRAGETSEPANSDKSGVAATLDKNKATIFHSMWNSNKIKRNNPQKYFPYQPLKINYHLDDEHLNLDIIEIVPRQEHYDGSINDMDIYYKTKINSQFRLLGNYKFPVNEKTIRVEVNDVRDVITAIQLSINKTSEFNEPNKGTIVAFAEIKFIHLKEHNPIKIIKSIFTDVSASELKNTVTPEKIMHISNDLIRQNAIDLYNIKNKKTSLSKIRDYQFKIASFNSIPHPKVQAKKNKYSIKSPLDNVTGIYFEKDKEYVILASGISSLVKVVVIDYVDVTKSSYSKVLTRLHNGINKITAKSDGLVYILHNELAGSKLKLNFLNGNVNGYFDIEKHKGEWKSLIQNANYKFFDVLGKKSHLPFFTEKYKKLVDDIEPLIDFYDNLVSETEKFHGHVYDNTESVNRLLFVIENRENPVATQFATYYPLNDKLYVAKDIVDDTAWMLGHEVGHAYQVRPNFAWAGMGEVTSNLNSLHFTIDVLKLKSRLVKKNKYKQSFNLMDKGEIKSFRQLGDPWKQVIPFWQLKLYLIDVLGQKDFYHELYKELRNAKVLTKAEHKKLTHGYYQLKFVKLACKVAKLNLIDFFNKWGFLSPVNITNNKGESKFVITQEQIEETKNFILQQGYPDPNIVDLDIFKITDENVKEYKNK